VASAVPERTDHQPLGLAGALFTLLLALLWAGTAVTARDAVDYVPPLAVGGIRFALASVFMLAWCRWEGVSMRMRREYWRPSLNMGLLLYLQIALFNWGVAWSNSSHATLLVNTYIFLVAAYEHFVTRSIRLSAWQGAGLLVAAIGAGVLLLDDSAVVPSALPAGGRTAATGGGPDPVTLTGDLLLLLSAVVLAVKVMYTKAAVRQVPSGTLILWHDLIGAGLFFLTSLPLETWPRDDWTPRLVVSLLYNGLVVSGFCFAGHAWMLRRHSASSISVFSFATPVFGVVLAVWLRGDVLSSWLVVSGVLVASGILAVNSPARRRD
jgi:drug/metabolite transporter (DMT)-like permease